VLDNRDSCVGDGKWRWGCLERIVRYATLFFGTEWLNFFLISGPDVFAARLTRTDYGKIGCTPPSPQRTPATHGHPPHRSADLESAREI
jgi:hypothetical protein